VQICLIRVIRVLLIVSFLISCSTAPTDVSESGGASEVEVTGKVLDGTGSPAADIQVTLREKSYLAKVPGLTKRSTTRDETETDAKGVFRFSAVDTGAYFIEANDWSAHALLLDVEVRGDTNLAEKTLAPVAEVTGSVTLSGAAADVYVQVYGLERLIKVDNSDGSYAISDLPAGEYTLRIVPVVPEYGVKEIRTPVLSPGDSRNLGAITLLSYLEESYADWQYSQNIIINTSPTGADIADNLHNFPLLIRLSSSSPFDQAQSDGTDIRFAKQDGTPLHFEIEDWDAANRRAVVWVLMDTVYGSSDSQSISMYWGKDNTLDFSNSTTVFETVNGFAGIWHFAAVSPFSDATLNGNHVLINSTVASEGRIGTSRFFNGADSMVVPDDPTLEPADLTVSCWFNWQGNGDTASDYAKMLAKGSIREPFQSYVLELHKYMMPHAVGAYDSQSGEGRFYLNGILVGTYLNPNGIEYYPDVDYPLYFGCQKTSTANFSGMIDEIRLSKTARSDAWIKLCYENQKEGSQVVEFK
jgi:hypothetical protein